MSISSKFNAKVLQNGAVWNKEWLQSNGKHSYLANCWQDMHECSDTFAQTSQDVTAAMLRWKSPFYGMAIFEGQ